jgi:ADP-ribosylglycohydrolase
MVSRDKAKGCLFGLAIGDALAAPTEFLSVAEIIDRYGEKGPEAPSPKVTDDTQMMLAVGEALLETTKPVNARSFEEVLRRHFIKWYRSPENNRAPGTSCMQACEAMRLGHDWVDATITNSKGCGANMRVAPVSLLSKDLPGMTERNRAAIAQFQAALTHGHPTALAAADLTCAAIHDLAMGNDPVELLQRLRDYAVSQRHVYHAEWLGRLWQRPGVLSPEEYIEVGWEDCIQCLDRVETALINLKDGQDPCEETGEGWVADEALATALLCFLLTPQNPVAAIRRAAVTCGDSDSIAAIAGALAGAHLGVEAWPIAWVERIEYRDRLEGLTNAMTGGTSVPRVD